MVGKPLQTDRSLWLQPARKRDLCSTITRNQILPRTWAWKRILRFRWHLLCSCVWSRVAVPVGCAWTPNPQQPHDETRCAIPRWRLRSTLWPGQRNWMHCSLKRLTHSCNVYWAPATCTTTELLPPARNFCLGVFLCVPPAAYHWGLEHSPGSQTPWLKSQFCLLAVNLGKLLLLCASVSSFLMAGNSFYSIQMGCIR